MNTLEEEFVVWRLRCNRKRERRGQVDPWPPYIGSTSHRQPTISRGGRKEISFSSAFNRRTARDIPFENEKARLLVLFLCLIQGGPGIGAKARTRSMALDSGPVYGKHAY